MKIQVERWFLLVNEHACYNFWNENQGRNIFSFAMGANLSGPWPSSPYNLKFWIILEKLFYYWGFQEK